MSPLRYSAEYGKAVLVTVCTGAVTVWLAMIVPFEGILKLAVQFLFVMLIPNAGYFLVYRKTPEFCYLKEILLGVWKKLYAAVRSSRVS